MASVGLPGRERPVWISEDGLRFLPATGPSWRAILEEGVLAAGLAAARRASAAEWRPLEGQRLGPPIPEPSKYIAVGLNYRAHAEEQGKKPPERPMLFAKAASCLVGPRDPIRLPPHEPKVDAEAELLVVIGRRCKDLSPEEARDAILGYAVANDVSGREAQYGDKQFFRGKSFDTFGPTGPWIVPAGDLPDPNALSLRCFWNETKMQESTTADLIFPVFDLVAYASRQMTLLPGDLIATGTPSGVGVFRDPPVFLKAGDRVRVEIDGIGVLDNPVEAG